VRDSVGLTIRWSRSERSVLFDANVGFRYAPNFTGERGSPWFSHWRTNQRGHVSRSDYPQHKPVGEFRIAILGDSFTAGITSQCSGDLSACGQGQRIFGLLFAFSIPLPEVFAVSLIFDRSRGPGSRLRAFGRGGSHTHI